MFLSGEGVRVLYYAEPVDMRKSFYGLYALVKNTLGEDALSGDLYVFCNRSRNYVKCLYFDRSGFCIWAKRLEQGSYLFPSGEEEKRELSLLDFKLVLEGVEVKRKSKRFSLSKAA
jgi:transposase